MIAVLRCPGGCDDAEALQDQAEKEQDWLADYLELRWGVTSQDTFLRVLAAVDQSDFRPAFLRRARAVFPGAVAADQIAVDGKTARRSGDRKADEKAVHMVSALACDAMVVLAQMPTASKSSEVHANRALLKILEVQGSLVGIDAIACPTDVAKRIVERGGDYLLSVKDNQSGLRQQVVEAFDATALEPTRNVDRLGPPAHETHSASEAGHSRIETRTTTVIHDFGDWLDEATRERWQGLDTLVRIESRREHEATGKVETESRYYISSRRMTAAQVHHHVRSHWEVENGLHYVLDLAGAWDLYRGGSDHAAIFFAGSCFAVSLRRGFDGGKVEDRERLLAWAAVSRLLVLALRPSPG